MDTMLLLAAFLIVAIGLAHSILGERYLLIRLFRRDNLPHLLGSDVFTKAVLRFAWHITTVAWFGFAALLAAIGLKPDFGAHGALLVTAAVFGCSALVALVPSRGRHYSWLVFLSIAILSWVAALRH